MAKDIFVIFDSENLRRNVAIGPFERVTEANVWAEFHADCADGMWHFAQARSPAEYLAEKKAIMSAHPKTSIIEGDKP